MTRAESLDEEIRDKLSKSYDLGGILMAAGNLALSQHSGAWKELGSGHSYETFREYVEDVSPLPWADIDKAMRLVELVADQKLTVSELADIGFEKGKYIIELLEQGRLTSEQLQIAKAEPLQKLKHAIGKKGALNLEHSIRCERCGNVIHGAKWTGKEK